MVTGDNISFDKLFGSRSRSPRSTYRPPLYGHPVASGPGTTSANINAFLTALARAIAGGRDPE
jgi:hypothetical protein